MSSFTSAAPVDKPAHYLLQVQLVLTSGTFTDENAFPAKDAKGYPISWTELLRKFDKHCTGEHYAGIGLVARSVWQLSRAIAASEGDGPTEGEQETLYKLDPGATCILHGEKRKEQAREAYESIKKLPKSDISHLALAYHAYALEHPEDTLSHLADLGQDHTRLWVLDAIPRPTCFPSGAPSDVAPSTGSQSIEDIRSVRAWALTETMRGVALKGMAQEKLNKPEDALQTYTTALPLLSTIETEIISLAQAAFREYQELWKWVVITIWRGAICSQGGRTWLGHYERCSAGWWAASSADWLVREREAICVLYLRSELDGWRRIVTEYRAILGGSTSFPRAGQRNERVEEFVQMVMAVWEKHGGAWIVDVLWWATRLTFNAYVVFRSQIRALYVQGDFRLARRNLQLYVAVVDKAWEIQQGSGADTHADADTDEKYAETLVYGIRMLCRTAAVEDAKLALELVGRIAKRCPNPTSPTKLAEGLVEIALGTALHEHDRFNRAHVLFVEATELDAQSWVAQWYLAISYARFASNLDQALVHAALAVEAAPKEVRCWHLLGLLSAAKEEWNAAGLALETGVQLEEDEWAESQATGPAIEGLPTISEGIPPDHKHIFVDGRLPPASTLVGNSLLDHEKSGSKLEDALQIRMSQIALAERVQGVEGAADLLPSVFSWIAERKGWASQTQAGVPRISVDAKTDDAHETPAADVTSEGHLPVPPVAINVSPATPEGENAPPSSSATPSSTSSAGATTDTSTSLPPAPAPAPSQLSPHGPSKKVSQLLHLSTVRISKLGETTGSRIVDASRAIGKGSRRGGKHNHHHGSIRSPSPNVDFPEWDLGAKEVEGYSSIHSRSRLRPGSEFIEDAPPPSSASSAFREPTGFGSSTSTFKGKTSTLPPQKQPRRTRLRAGSAESEARLISDVWLLSAAVFRRLGKIEQCRGAIQEAETRDEGNAAVWVQLGLYQHELGHRRHAVDAYSKALMLDPDHVAALVWLARVWIEEAETAGQSEKTTEPVDLAVGLLKTAVKGRGWDSPEAWWLLAKAYRLQPKREAESKDALKTALELTGRRGKGAVRTLPEVFGDSISGGV
ncbi:hypothetical protein CYLTODRAFT_426757 [Cylindrobasidium torrendii FP15055 ss-10]|uniref:TPR-like protein n=1 Tax=Cylindrobasidium torrendii FP15055 ss-10 TaxID=1314674 RepID=A0A0D7AWN3_9AGAR|nr:hypothetical protein CYLTODRAFT_426757 [Cylindrobasidium torrendii FP15055 ss-10]